MAAYVIDLLKCLNLTSMVAYFFCKGGQPGLTRPCEILWTIAFQCLQADEKVRAVVDNLFNTNFQIEENLGFKFLFEKVLCEPLRVPKKRFISS